MRMLLASPPPPQPQTIPMNPSRPPARTGQRLRRLAALGLVLLAGGCAAVSAVSRADLPTLAQAERPASQAVAAQLQVSGQRGRLSRPEREQLLARLGREGSASLLTRQLAAMTAADSPQLYAGNNATLLIDGPATFAAMSAAIEQARSSVLIQSYIIEDSSVARQLAELLLKKRAQGVPVLLLYDAVGSIKTTQAFFDSLHAAGVPTCAINPVNPLLRPGYWNITERDHRKIVTVDRQIGFTGGINISGAYASGSFGRGGRARANPDLGWRDTQVRLQGPAVAALDDLVRQTWQEQGCQGDLPALPAAQAGAAAAAAGPSVVRVIPASPGEPVNRIYTMLLTAIDAAQRSVHLTMAYFAPGAEMVDALCDAAERGVDVQLVLPAQSDFGPVLHAGRSYYSRLLGAGVKIHELKDATLHAKTAVVDGVLSTVGSSNMDWRSFTSNSEANAVVFGEDFGDAMTRMFRTDVANASTISPAAWQARPVWQQGKEWLARWLERFW